jgi:MFS family permease
MNANNSQFGTGGINLRSSTFAAMNYRNYRLWFIGQLISLIGTWMQSTAQGYLVYQLTNSPAYLGLVGFVGGAPTILLTLYGGYIADRVPRRTLLIATQTLMLILAFILAGLTFTNLIKPWHILILAFLLGVANSFDAPARTSFITELVDRKDITNAIAFNSTMFNIGTVLGPAVAGITYAAYGPAWCFTINGISFIAVIIALLFMKITPVKQRPHQANAMKEIGEGVRYVFANRLILNLIISVGIVSIFGIGLLNLLPAWAKDVLHGDVTTNGWLISARGLGSLISALMLAYLGSRRIRGKLWTAGSFIMPVTLFIFAYVRWLPMSIFLLTIVGWGFMMILNNSQAIVQTIVSDHLRGRVMGVYTLIFFGSMPLGSLFAGSVAEKLGEPVAVLLGAAFLMVWALVFRFVFPEIRRQE